MVILLFFTVKYIREAGEVLSNKKIMLGNEAIARGAYEAGVKVTSAYPGTPSTEVVKT